MPTDDHALVNKATWDEDARNWIQRGRAQPYWVPAHEHKDEVSGGRCLLTPALHAGARFDFPLPKVRLFHVSTIRVVAQDDSWLPITYRVFHDIPRMILVEFEGAFYLFDCPFDNEIDDYPSDFTVYRLEPEAGHNALESRAWLGLAEEGTEVGHVRVEEIHLDPSRRKLLAASVFDLLAE